MEDQIAKAEQTKSKCGEFCKILGIATIVLGATISVHDLIFKVNRFQELSIWIASGAALTAFGKNATSNKRTAELTALLVRSTNSASQLPQNESSSKFNEDSTRAFLNRI